MKPYNIDGTKLSAASMDEINTPTETDAQRDERLKQALMEAQQDFDNTRKVIEKVTAPMRALADKLASVPVEARHNHPEFTELYREVREMRKLYSYLRRLPKGHPDKIIHPLAEMETA